METTFQRKGTSMALKKGDRVTLSVAPQIQLEEYHNLKPMASVTRDVGDNPEEDLRDMAREVRKLVCRGVLIQLEAENDLIAVLEHGDVDSLVKFCQKEIGYVPETVGSEGSGSTGTTGSAAKHTGPTKKGPSPHKKG